MTKRKSAKLIKEERIADLKKRTQQFLDLVDGKISEANQEESYTRGKFINEVESVFGGAAVEYFKCLINDRMVVNHQDRAHWEKEWKEHLGPRLRKQLQHPKKFSDLGKAFEQAIKEEYGVVNSLMNTAINTMAKYLGLPANDVADYLFDDDAHAFFQEARNAFRLFLEGKEVPRREPEIPWNQKPRKTKRVK